MKKTTSSEKTQGVCGWRGGGSKWRGRQQRKSKESERKAEKIRREKVTPGVKEVEIFFLSNSNENCPFVAWR